MSDNRKMMGRRSADEARDELKPILLGSEFGTADPEELAHNTAKQERVRWLWLLGIVYLVMVTIIWSAASVFVQYIFHDLGFNRPLFLTYVANSLFIVNLPLSYATKLLRSKVNRQTIRSSDWVTTTERERSRHVPYTTAQTAQIALIICPLWFLANYSYNAGLNLTSVSSSTVISTTSVLFTFLFSVCLLAERFSAIKLLGVVACMLGNVLTTLHDKNGSGNDTVLGDLLCLLSAAMYGTYTTAIRKLIPDDERVSISLFFGLLGLFNAVIFLPIVLVCHFSGAESLSALNWQILGLLVVKGLLDNVLSDYLWAKAVIYTSPTVATVGLSLTIPMAVLSDMTLHHILPTTLSCLAAALVLLGFVAINIGSMEKVNQQPADAR